VFSFSRLFEIVDVYHSGERGYVPHVIEGAALLLEHQVVVSTAGSGVSLPHLEEVDLGRGR
jgi:hypothetical protein